MGILEQTPGIRRPARLSFSVSDVEALNAPGVYFLYDGDNLVYVGQSRHIPSRISQHLRKKELSFSRVEVLSAPVENLRDLEAECIARYLPRDNKTGPRAKDMRDYELALKDPRN